MTQYRLSYDGIVLATGYTYTDALQVRTLLAQEYDGVVLVEAYIA